MSLGRILLAVAVAACLLGVGVLEVLSERAPREQVLPTFPKVGDLRSDDSEPWWESGEAVTGQALEATLTAPEGALSLTSPEPGDVLRIQPAGGQAQPTSVVRHAWRQSEEIER